MILNYQFLDNGKPILVMIHGLLSSLETFLPLRGQLEKHFSLLLVDQRGHGQSPRGGSDYSAETMAGDLKDVMDHLGIKKCIILGHSMGGRTALMFAKLYPQMVEKLIIEDMGIHVRQKRTPEKDAEKAALARSCYTETLTFKSKEEIYDLISPLFSYASELMKTKVTESPKGYELKFWPDVSVLYGYQGNYSDLTAALSETDFPVLFIMSDPAVGSALTPTCIEHIKTHVPRAVLHEIKGAWHNVHKTRPNEFCQAVINFCHLNPL